MFDFFFKRVKPQHLFFETDVHCHLAPGIDDGQQTASGGADLMERESQWGISRIILTPHITQDTFENTPEIITDAVNQLKDEVNSRGIHVALEYSAEHRLDAFFRSELENGNIKPFPGNYLLVENPFVQEAWDLDNQLFDLNIKGYKPVLAHPERYAYYFSHPERYEQLHSAGTLFQINLLSLAGYYGRSVKKIAEMLISKQLVDFVGSDMHNLIHAEAIERYLLSHDYRKHAQALKTHILNDKL